MKRTIRTLSLLHICLFSLLTWSQDVPKGADSLHITQEWVDKMEKTFKSECYKASLKGMVDPPYDDAFIDALGPGFDLKVLLHTNPDEYTGQRRKTAALKYGGKTIFNTRHTVWGPEEDKQKSSGKVFLNKPSIVAVSTDFKKNKILTDLMIKDDYSLGGKVVEDGYIFYKDTLLDCYKLIVYSKMSSYYIYFVPSLDCFWGLEFLNSRAYKTEQPTMKEIQERHERERAQRQKLQNSSDQYPQPRFGACNGRGQGLEKITDTTLGFPELLLCTEITPVYAGFENAPSLRQSLFAKLMVTKRYEGQRNEKLIWSATDQWYDNQAQYEYGITNQDLVNLDLSIPFAYKIASQTFYTASQINKNMLESFDRDDLSEGHIEIFPFSEFGASTLTLLEDDVLKQYIQIYKGLYHDPLSFLLPQAVCPDTIAHELAHSTLARTLFWDSNNKPLVANSIVETYADIFSVIAKHQLNNDFNNSLIPSTNNPLNYNYTKSLFQVASCFDRSHNPVPTGRFLLDPKLSGEIDHLSQFDGSKDEHFNSTVLSLVFAYLMLSDTNLPHPSFADSVPRLKGIGINKVESLLEFLFVGNITSNEAFFPLIRQEAESYAATRFGQNSYEHRAVSDAFEAVGIFHPTVAVEPLQTYQIPYALENSTRLFQITLPASVDLATIRLEGSNGNADIYYTFGSRLDPWLGDYQGRSQDFGSNDELIIPRSQQGPPAVLTFAIHATEAFANLRLLVDLQGSGFSTPMGVDLPQSESAPFQRKLFPIQIPQRNQKRLDDPNYDICYTPNTRLVITTRGGQEHENLDLYLKQGREAAFNDYDFRATDGRANETLEVLNPPPGEWFLALNSQTTYDDVILRIEYYENEMYDNLEMRINASEGEVVYFTKPIAEGSARLRIDANGGEGRFHFYANPYPAPEDLDDWQFATNNANALKLEIREADLDTDRYALAITPRDGYDLRHVKYFATLSPKPRDQPPQLLVAGHESTLLDNGLDIYRFKSGAILNVQGSLLWSSRIERPNYRPLVSVDIFQDGRLLEQRSTYSDCRGFSEFQLELTPEMIGAVQLKFVYQYNRGESVPAWLNLDVQHDGDFLVSPTLYRLMIQQGTTLNVPLHFENRVAQDYQVTFSATSEAGEPFCSVVIPRHGSSAPASHLSANNFYLKLDATNLALGTHEGELIARGGPNNFEQIMPVMLEVVPANSGQLNVLPDRPTISLSENTEISVSEVTLFNASDFEVYVSAQENAPWLELDFDSETPLLANETRAVPMRINTNGLTPGQTYQTQVFFNSNAGSVPCVLTLRVQDGPEICTQPLGATVFQPGRVMIWDQLAAPGVAPPGVVFDVWNCGLDQLNYEMIHHETEIAITPASGSSHGTPNTHRAKVQSQAWPPGHYNEQFTIDDVDNPRRVGPVGKFRLTITSAEGAFPLLKRAPNVIRTAAGRAPAAYNLEVSNPGQGTLRYAWRTDQPWVDVSNPVVNLKQTDGVEQHALSFDMGGLEAGRHGFTLSFDSDAGSQDYEMVLEVLDGGAICVQSAGVTQSDPAYIQVQSADLSRSQSAQITLSNCGAEPLAYKLQPITTTSHLAGQSDFRGAMSGEVLQPGETRTLDISAARSLDAQQPAEVWAIVDVETNKVIGHIEIGTPEAAAHTAW